MMRFNSPDDVLKFWQEIHGQLEAKWIKKFISDHSIKEILKFSDEQIAVALRRNMKLREVLQDLYDQDSAKDEFKRKLNPYFESFEDRGPPDKPQMSHNWMKYGGRWKRQF